MTQECAYCPAPAETEDDIPPKAMFGGRRSTIRVPSCRACNNGASAHDEYFRLALCFHEDVGNLAAAQPAVRKAQRSLLHPKAPGLRADFLKRTRMWEEQTDAGLWHVRTETDIEVHRVNRVAARIVKALFYAHQGRRLPSERCAPLCGATSPAMPLRLARNAVAIAVEPRQAALSEEEHRLGT